MSDQKYNYGVGRRKRSTARAKYYQSSDELKITVNGKLVSEYFPEFYAKLIEKAVLLAGLHTGKIDLFISGGGVKGQAEAARLAICKSLVKSDVGFKPILKMHKFLTTDIRKVLPKKAGFRKNRKKEQWSKR